LADCHPGKPPYRFSNKGNSVSSSESMQLNLEISASDATEEDVDRMTRQLLTELRETDVESAELAKRGAAPKGSKGDPVTMGSIALVVLPAMLPKVLDFVQAWALRGQGRSVKFKGKIGGQKIEFEGSAEEFQKLLATLGRGKKK
jgi:hypothetical protein